MGHCCKVLIIVSFSFLLSCGGSKDKSKGENLCSYVFADSLRGWIHKRMPDSSKQWLVQGDTIKLFFYEDAAKKLWQPEFSDSAVNELSRSCGFTWKELSASDGNRRWELSLPFEKKDTSYRTPNNLLTYLFRQ